MTVLEHPPVEKEKEVDNKALRIFLKALEIAGGPRKLFEYRHLTWLPSLMEAAYVIVLSRDHQKMQADIAKELGLSPATVKNILVADEQKVKERLKEEIEGEEAGQIKTHVAGGLAKLAYQEIAQGRDNIDFLVSMLQSYLGDLAEIIWPLEVLSRIKGLDFPVEKETLTAHLGDLTIRGKQARELLDHLSYPLASPAALLQELAQQLRS
ncbi:MAG: bacterio-opsin activator [Thermogemmatispora sp.]|uniref:hypothetical protein n=1 Tax=Thermogemmatispora sp. TaxID=1968838 RepID=UPI0019FF1A1D|nr:hypothetical protein [Thermogemmatispora sp.]MBE3566725.1 bacterio-opsin activator [Thermogemmatispora sp.]